METTSRTHIVAFKIALIVMILLIFFHLFSGRISIPSVETMGKPRNVDMTKVRRLINEGKMSTHKALYYKDADKAN